MTQPPRAIYLDNNATTPVDPRVRDRMLRFFDDEFGNAASRTHPYGWRAEEAVERARKEVAESIGCQPREIVFTSGATESNNIALFGVLGRTGGGHIVTSSIEHHAVIDPCKHLSTSRAFDRPIDVTFVRPDSEGRVSVEQVQQAITNDTVLVSIMAANNEVGTLNPIGEIGRMCRERGVVFHTDAAQATGKIPIDVESQKIDLLSVSGHKMYAPKGVGALYVRSRSPRVRLAPMFFGGGHERGLRPGTLNVPGIVGLGTASTIAVEGMSDESASTRRLRDRLHDGIRGRVDGVHLNGHATERLPGNLNLSFEAVQGEALLVGLKDLSVSSGSACTSSTLEPSYVLRALGVSRELAHASIRFGCGRFNTENDIDVTIETVVSTVSRLREISSACRS